MENSSHLSPSHPFPSIPFPSLLNSLAGKLVLNEQTYSSGIGDFDKVAIDYGYRVFTEMDENPLLRELIDKAELNGYCFLTDQVRATISFSALPSIDMTPVKSVYMCGSVLMIASHATESY